MASKEKIAVLTSGGDAPGMNAAVRAVVRTGIARGYQVCGIMHGYDGLMHREIKEMHFEDVSDILAKPGTILYTARSQEFMPVEGKKKAAEICKDMGIGHLIVIGGDGSFKGALDLSQFGVNIIGLPGTIDLDIAYTDYTIGFDSAVTVAMKGIDALEATCDSHGRCSVVEVMGRSAGYIALWAGLACGAEATLLPEDYDHDEEKLFAQIKKNKENGYTHQLVVNAEGVGDSYGLAERIQKATGVESRATILGHVQRGGIPTVRDRVAGTMMGAYAVDVIDRGGSNRLVGIRNGKVYDVDAHEGLAMQKTLDPYMVEINKVLAVRP